MENQTTLPVALDQWLNALSVGRKPSTLKFNREVADAVLKHWHEPALRIEFISRDDVLFFAQNVAHYCPSRWNLIVSLFRFVTPAFFPQDRTQHLLKRKPLRFRQFVPPGQSQFESLLAECDAARKGCHVGLVVRFLCLTGLRKSEAYGLRWKNIFEDRVEVPASKNGQMRSVPILAGLGDVLARLKKVGDGEFVLPRESARKAVESACDRAGLGRMSFHCFRHIFATRCIESGVDVPTVALWLGHKDKGVTLSKTYFHLLSEHSRNMAAKVKIAV